MYYDPSKEWGAPAGAPAERTDAPTPESIGPAVRRHTIYNPEYVTTPHSDEWREPIYSQAPEAMQNMYSPGYCVNQPYSRRNIPEAAPKQKARERSGLAGWFLRAACLALVCALLSGAVTYGVIEYRFRNHEDNPVINQVVLGGSSELQDSGGLSTPVLTANAGMSAEDIYVMACSQVVGISTMVDVPNIVQFGSTTTSPTVAVAGSGFIISSDGYILTNYHVVESAFQNNLPLIVILNDGSEHEAKVIGYEVNNDVAVIKIEASGLNPAVIANSDNIKVGQAVYAVGNPLGELVYTMTEGIVSARDREVSVEGKIVNTFQFSAAVNSGNSGGPIYDTNGEVIGIVTAKPMRTAVEGIGFAIPINDAIEIAAELIEFGYITGRPFMGITANTVTRVNAEYYGWDVVGVYVKSVSEGSAAEKAGMLMGDIIIKMGDADIDSMETLRYAMRKFRAGESTMLTIWRGGEEVELQITFDEDLSAGQAK